MELNKYIENKKVEYIDSEIPTIGTGVLFIYAPWAPYTYKLDLLLNSLIKRDVKVYAIDIDNPNLYQLLKVNDLVDKCQIGGWGEIFWFKNNGLIGYLGKEFNEEKLTQYNTLLGW